MKDFQNKSLGQHFLRNPAITDRIVDFATPQGNVVEVGPGKGILTFSLMKIHQIKKLILLEVDGNLCEFLRKNIPDPRVEIIHMNALKFENFPPSTTIVANLPYNISKQLFIRWVMENDIQSMTIMLQKEVALSLSVTVGNKNYKMISVLSNLFFQPKICFHLSPRSFFPAPKVESTVIRLDRIKNFNEENHGNLLKMLKIAFSSGRKKISNIFKNISEEKRNKRPQELSPEEYLEILTNNYGLF